MLSQSPAITFALDSDIAIRDGQAAIEFRSYDSGKTVIRATSPGLADATIEITSLGEPEFIPGQTPPVKPRPYVRFTGQPASVPATRTNLIFGLENPTQASSEAPGHNASLGNDGNQNTFWSAANSSAGAWWEVDLERLCLIKGVKIIFPAAGNYRYQIETSDDHQQWRRAVDESQTLNATQTRSDTCAPGSGGRFVRITFTSLPLNTPAQISEMQIIGNVRPQ